MTESKLTIAAGIYLVIDPAMDEKNLLYKLANILNEKIVAVQLWDNFRENQPIEKLVQEIYGLCSVKNVPVLINNQWEYLMNTALSGVHFDHIPENFECIKAKVNKPFITGITCTNDLAQVHWAAAHQLDYISFCSMFPSSTATSCELVNFDTVREAGNIFKKPVFLAGGIKPENIYKLSELNYSGIAVISGIMNAENPIKSIQEYYENLILQK